MGDSAAAKPWPHKTDAIAARIIPWAGDTLGVAYDFPDGKHTAHPIQADDWPIIRNLGEFGRLTYSSDAVRDRAAKSTYGPSEQALHCPLCCAASGRQPRPACGRCRAAADRARGRRRLIPPDPENVVPRRFRGADCCCQSAI